MSVKISPETEAKIESLVATGQFSDRSAVLDAAIDLLAGQQEELDWLREQLAVAEEQIVRGETHLFSRERFEAIRDRALSDR